MRKITLYLCAVALFGSCAQNIAPTCVITSPSNGDEIEQGTVVTVIATGEDADGNLSEVQVSIDNQNVSSSTNSTVSYSWNTTGLSEGSHSIFATATDDEGEQASDNISVTITSTQANGGDNPCPGTPTVTDIDGNVYNTVQIGDQCWMEADLKVTKYPDGTSIPHVTTDSDWIGLGENDTDDAYCFYDGYTYGDASDYGALYTWSAAMGDDAVSSSTNPSGVQGVCPTGWHLPSKEEWFELINYLGGQNVAGGKMKEEGTSHWVDPNTGADNGSGFKALPNGKRESSTAVFSQNGYNANWWSATEGYGTPSDASFRVQIYHDNIEMDGSYYLKSSGVSIRCVKD